MQEWINRALEAPGIGITVVAALVLLGMLSAVASTCCSLPVVGAITGYVGTGETTRRALFLRWPRSAPPWDTRANLSVRPSTVIAGWCSASC
ncbi:MAG: hypothetical protein V1694_07440 [Candidatus Eisenbacteria bacterium]